MKFDRKKINIPILILSIIAIFLASFLILLMIHPREVVTIHHRYNWYHDNLIEIEKVENLEIDVNLYDDDRSLAVLLKSKKEENKLITVLVSIINNKEEKIYEKEQVTLLLGGSKEFMRISLPELEGEILKEIHISTTEEDSSVETDYKKITFVPEINTSLGSKKETNVEVKWNSAPSSHFKNVAGSILLMKDGKVVESTSFIEENVENGLFHTNVSFRNKYQDNELKALEYDKVEAFVSSYEIVE